MDRKDPLPDGEPETLEYLAALSYDEYLRSASWQRLRSAAIAASQQRCSSCGKAGPLHVHHLRRPPRGTEGPDDVAALCPQCHREAHGVTAGLWGGTIHTRERIEVEFREELLEELNVGYFNSDSGSYEKAADEAWPDKIEIERYLRGGGEEEDEEAD